MDVRLWARVGERGALSEAVTPPPRLAGAATAFACVVAVRVAVAAWLSFSSSSSTSSPGSPRLRAWKKGATPRGRRTPHRRVTRCVTRPPVRRGGAGRVGGGGGERVAVTPALLLLLLLLLPLRTTHRGPWGDSSGPGDAREARGRAGASGAVRGGAAAAAAHADPAVRRSRRGRASRAGPCRASDAHKRGCRARRAAAAGPR